MSLIKVTGWIGGWMVLASALAGCATKDVWMGADAEKAYDKKLDSKRMAELFNNGEYFEIHKDKRIYAFSSGKAVEQWKQTDEIPLVVTQIGSGPNGETVKMQLTKAEGKAMEQKAGYKGAAQKMYEGELAGIEIGFYGEVNQDKKIWVFENGKDLQAFKQSGEVPCGITQIGAGPEGKTVVFVQNCKAAAKAKPEESMARFKKSYGLN